MKYLSQTDLRWAGEQLGTCLTTIGLNGCALLCVSMLAGKDPLEVNEILKNNYGYSKGCLVNWNKAAILFDLPYSTVRSNPIRYPCIIETDHYKSVGLRQHFFIMLNQKEMIDPLDKNPIPRQIYYRIVSYRNLSIKESEGKMDLDAVVKILHQTWRIFNKMAEPDDVSIRREAEECYKKYEGGEKWAFSGLINSWWENSPLKKELEGPENTELKTYLRKILELIK